MEVHGPVQNLSLEFLVNRSGVLSRIPNATALSIMFSAFYFLCPEIRDASPRLSNLGASSLGEDVDMCGDTLDEAIRDGPRGRNLQFNWRQSRNCRSFRALPIRKLIGSRRHGFCFRSTRKQMLRSRQTGGDIQPGKPF